MASDTFYEQEFICSTKHFTFKRLIWFSEIDKQKCECKDKKCKPQLREKTNEAFTVGGKHKNGRSAKEKVERRVKNFRQEVLPTLGGFERKHFIRKYGKPL